jgi:hypothetical protein
MNLGDTEKGLDCLNHTFVKNFKFVWYVIAAAAELFTSSLKYRKVRLK